LSEYTIATPVGVHNYVLLTSTRLLVLTEVLHLFAATQIQRSRYSLFLRAWVWWGGVQQGWAGLFYGATQQPYQCCHISSSHTWGLQMTQ